MEFFLLKNLASLYAGELVLLITGCISMLFLCIFSCALRLGGDVLICVRYLALCLFIRVFSFIVWCICCWYSLISGLIAEVFL